MTRNLDEQAEAILRDAVVIDAHGHTLELAFRTGKRLHHPLGSRRWAVDSGPAHAPCTSSCGWWITCTAS
jgi:hypothetical protein